MTQLGTLQGSHYRKVDGTQAEGTILIELLVDKPTIRDEAGNVIWAGDITVPLAGGAFTVTLPAGDGLSDPPISPSVFSYRVTEQLKHVSKPKYRTVIVQVPTGGTLDLADVEGGVAATPVLAQPITQTQLDTSLDDYVNPFLGSYVTAAQLAETNAETAETNAETALGAAVVARTGAETAQGLAEDARDEASAIALGDAETALVAGIEDSDSAIGSALSASYAGRGKGTVGSRAALPYFSKFVREYNDNTAPVGRIIGLGSSVGQGATLPDVATQAPVARLFERLSDAINPLGNMNLTVTNGSVGGTAMISSINGDADYADAKTAAGGTPVLVAVAYGMNDGEPALYHNGQTYPGVYTHGKTLLDAVRADGGDCIFFTTPHPHSTRHPAWTMPDGIPVIYPASGVMIPDGTTGESVVMVTSPSGESVPASYRHLRVNEAIRSLANYGAVVIDVEAYWFDAVAKHGEDALYDTGQYNHPNLLGHQESYWAAIEDFVRGLDRGAVISHPAELIPEPAAPGRFTETVAESGALSISSGETITIPVPANSYGEVELWGTSGGGWHSRALLGVIADGTTAKGSALYGTAFTAPGQLFSGLGTPSGLNVVVNTTATGAGGQVKWRLTTRPKD